MLPPKKIVEINLNPFGKYPAAQYGQHFSERYLCNYKVRLQNQVVL